MLQVLGLTTPAYKGGVMEGDVLVSVEDTLVTLMKHGQVNTECQMLQQLEMNIFLSHRPSDFF